MEKSLSGPKSAEAAPLHGDSGTQGKSSFGSLQFYDKILVLRVEGVARFIYIKEVQLLAKVYGNKRAGKKPEDLLRTAEAALPT